MSGSQSTALEWNVPRYGYATFSTSSCGRSSGTRTPPLGLSNIQHVAATTEQATCSVVALWPGRMARASSMLSSEPVHHDL